MLFIVLILVLAALGLLVTALITASQTWAWVSIALSLAAALVLVIDWLRRRGRGGEAFAAEQEDAEAEAAAGEATPVVDGPESAAPEFAQPRAGESEPETVIATRSGALPVDESENGTVSTALEAAGNEEPAERLEDRTVTTEPVVASGRERAYFDELDEIPGEEDTDAADLLIVCDLDDQVIVVDEHPRYHLAGCNWLSDRDTIPIAVAEARELGFTPCILCGPDSALASQHRKRQNARR